LLIGRDICAGDALIRASGFLLLCKIILELGGVFTDLKGVPYVYEKRLDNNYINNRGILAYYPERASVPIAVFKKNYK
jgi:hypothetical protein